MPAIGVKNCDAHFSVNRFNQTEGIAIFRLGFSMIFEQMRRSHTSSGSIAKNLLISSILIAVVAFPLKARADGDRICTRTSGSSVTLRTGPGTDYPPGLLEVGSGGAAVDRFFRQRHYTIADGEQISVFSSTYGSDGRVWLRVGTNQWVAWARADFVCQPEVAE